MVLMAVGDHKPFDLVQILFQVSDVRDYQINAQHIVRREGQAAVYYDNAVVIFKSGNVHADLFQTA